MGPVEKLLAIEEIKKLKARYFRAMDTKDRALYESVFTADVTLDAIGVSTDPKTGFNPDPNCTEDILRGRDAFVGMVFNSIQTPGYRSVHHGHMPEIDIIDDYNANGIWPMFDLVDYPSAGGRVTTMVGYGHYHETYRREQAGWKISSVRLTRLRVDYPAEQAQS